MLALGGLPLIGQAQIAGHTSGEVDPLGAQYFQNRYLGNPSMAGIDSALNINAAYRAQMGGSTPGAPLTQAVTVDDYIGKHVGLGLIAYNDQAGLFNKTNIAVTYAYHLQIGQRGQQLHFGLSLTYRNARIDPSKVIGDEGDPSIGNYNKRTDHFESDFGMSYTDEHWTLQAVLPNIVSFMALYPDNIRNRSTFFTAASYKLFVGSQVSIEPEVAYRGVQGLDNIVDMGANIAFLNNIVNVFALYHTSGNYSAGVGLHYKLITVQMIYSSQTSGLKNYFDGNYEVNVGLRLFGHQ
jgi:type IX secretion system PorP/SprF family membrane protein